GRRRRAPATSGPGSPTAHAGGDLMTATVLRGKSLCIDTPSGRPLVRELSFALARDRVALIGRNGAGKSTLLKILTNITKPTCGRAELYGRVGSLLEVGTGFHPELTGRENVFLNGAILGMTRAEIRRRFDEIVAFAEIERFLDSPVKRYSSGMYVRLAFAVAAHLDPEILLVDEVLSVGDAGFQRKCLGKMDDAARGGRTILFVSHNLGVVERLCHRVVLLQDGRVERVGPPQEVIRHYLEEVVSARVDWRRSAPYPELPHFRHVFLCDETGEPTGPPTSASGCGCVSRSRCPPRCATRSWRWRCATTSAIRSSPPARSTSPVRSPSSRGSIARSSPSRRPS
ncbi:MAG: ABC transporter ATP-binding protein, partial [Thermoanaerobaculia bacterium]|nr:ABC transporter ATP-binding protein [Thermoanaerobaculia bacterium]